VELAKKEAKVLITVSEDKAIGAWGNPDGRLGVIAIIGPGEFQGKMYGEAVLCEVGIGESRPYHAAKKPLSAMKGGEARSIAARRKWFSLTVSQYLAIAPILFLVFQKLTNEKVKNWEHGFFSDDPFLIPTAYNRFSRHQKKFFSVSNYRPQACGTRFSVSLEDGFLVEDVYWGELNNYSTLHRLRGLARFLDVFTSWNNGHKRKTLRISKGKEERIWKSLGPLSSKSPHLVPELLRYLPKHKLAFSYISNLVGGAHETAERKLASLALANPETRLNGISIRITTGISKRDHIVFEVAPRDDS